jgi:hypothetical protein
MGKSSQIVQIEFDDRSVLFDANAFDAAIRSHGVLMVHYAAQPCPVGKVDRYSVRRPGHDHSACQNGQIYTKMGTVKCLFINSGNKMDQYETGVINGTQATVTTPRHYEGTEDEVQVVPIDKFYLLDENLLVPHTQLVEAHITGKDRLSFPVEKVVSIYDSRGKKYCAEDYTIENGQIIWGQEQPGYDPVINMGTIYSIRYLYRPYFYVDSVLHQTRYITVDTGLEVKNIRGNQEMILKREHVYEKEEKDDQAPDPDSTKQVKGPRATPLGATPFGPR